MCTFDDKIGAVTFCEQFHDSDFDDAPEEPIYDRHKCPSCGAFCSCPYGRDDACVHLCPEDHRFGDDECRCRQCLS
jgi:hypothetical protein